MRRIRVAIAEENELFRKGLIALLSADRQLEVPIDMDSGSTFIEKIKGLNVPPDIALIDLNLPGFNGFELTQLLQKDYPNIHVIIFSAYDHDQSIAKAIDMGASGYITKSCKSSELFETIFKVYEQGSYFSKEILQRAVKASHYRNAKPDFSSFPVVLTKREKEILKLLCKEYSNIEIADRLQCLLYQN
ncbi:response regulator transcription factor [Pedobacter gandavensis]|uniref:response regulator transcription factor n=1 Tax=Pedobacter gandavensis TaxID=2679963 RepID=UPI00293059EF|nr:response regulator transcription factor [Pedobacter gandavensis]